MTPDHNDPVLDAFLDEAVGGRTPPDLSPQILAAWAAQGRTRFASTETRVPISAAAFDSSGAITASVERPRSKLSSELRANLMTIAAAGALVAIGLAIGAAAVLRTRGVPLADGQSNQPAVAAVPNSAPIEQPIVKPTIEQATKDSVADAATSTSVPSENREPSQQPSVSDSRIATTEPTTAPVEARTVAVIADAEVIALVNRELASAWKEAGVSPAPVATDAEWCERTFEKLLGRAPTPNEAKNFAADTSGNRREKLISRLLSNQRFAEQYAKHWAADWVNVLVGRIGGRGALASRDELQKYLQTAFAANKPYNEVAKELLTATGCGKPEGDDYNPAANFLLDRFDANAVTATARVARVFLGQRVECARCHSDESLAFSQDQYWSLNAFLRQMKVDRTGNLPKLVNVSLPRQGRGSRSGEIFYETPAGLMKTAFPRFLDGTEIPVSGELNLVDRRRELARLVTQSDEFAQATINRLWSHFFGYGLTQPVDDLQGQSGPHQRQILASLAEQLTARNYDLKTAMRWIVLSEPFNRSSTVTDLATKDVPENGQPPLFSRYYGRPPQVSDVAKSLAQAGQIRKSAGNVAAVAQARRDWLAQFNRKPTGNDGNKAIVSNIAAIPLLMSNQPTDLLKKITDNSNLKFDKKVEHLFLAVLAREPLPREQQLAATILQGSKGSEATALEDIWWALSHSDEAVLER